MRSFLLYRLRRPFSNAHWALFLVLVAGWDFVLLSRPCKEPPFYLEAVFATFTVCVALWGAHLRAGPFQSWRTAVAVAAGSIYGLALLLLTVVVVGIPIAVFQPEYQCYTPRAKVSEIILAAGAS